MEFSQYLISGFQDLHKTKGKDFGNVLNADVRMEKMCQRRRDIRNDFLLTQRHIDEKDMCLTPNQKSPVRHDKMSVDTQVDNRLKLLAKWKEEKASRLKEQKSKAKPPFKVTKAPSTFGIPTGRTENKMTGAKSVDRKPQTSSKYTFAPANYIFKGPVKLASLNMKQVNKVLPDAKKQNEHVNNFKRVTRSQTCVLPLPMKGKKQLEVKQQETPQIPNLNKNLKERKHPPLVSQNNVHDESVQKIIEHDRKNLAKKVVINDVKTEKNKIKTYKKTPGKLKKHVNQNKKSEISQSLMQDETQPANNTKLSHGTCKDEFSENSKNINSQNILNEIFEIPNQDHGRRTNRRSKSCPSKSICGEISNEQQIQKENDVNISMLHKQLEYDIEKENLTQTKEINSSRNKRKNFKKKSLSQSSVYKSNLNSAKDKYEETNKETTTPTSDSKNKSNDTSLSSEYPIGDVIDSTLNETFPKSEKGKTTPVSYISPFVTISRGKDRARKEYYERKSKGGMYISSPEFLNNTGPKAGAAYFHQLLDREVDRIQGLCEEWKLYMDEQLLPEGASDMINVAIGQSQLLITKKFKKFKELISSCENNECERLITCEDLHGYWDTAYLQVENLNKRFNNLENLRSNNWNEIIQEAKVIKPKKQVVNKQKVKAKSNIRELVRAARKKALSKEKDESEDLLKVTVFDGGFFSLRSPHKSPVIKVNSALSGAPKTPKLRKSLLASVLVNETEKDKLSPGLVVVTATQVARSIEKLAEMTPGKSILKSKNSKSSIKNNKSVLFNEKTNSLLPDNTPGQLNDENKSPGTSNSVRRSSRIRLTRNKLF